MLSLSSKQRINLISDLQILSPPRYTRHTHTNRHKYTFFCIFPWLIVLSDTCFVIMDLVFTSLNTLALDLRFAEQFTQVIRVLFVHSFGITHIQHTQCTQRQEDRHTYYILTVTICIYYIIKLNKSLISEIYVTPSAMPLFFKHYSLIEIKFLLIRFNKTKTFQETTK